MAYKNLVESMIEEEKWKNMEDYKMSSKKAKIATFESCTQN